MSLEWILLPSVGAMIGWFTNFIAIRMLFRPKKPVRLFGRFAFQGVLPRRQSELARIVGETVERDLLPVDELVESLDLSGYQDDVIEAVVGHVGRRIDQNLPDLLPTQREAADQHVCQAGRRQGGGRRGRRGHPADPRAGPERRQTR